MPFFGVPLRNGVPLGLGSVSGFGIAPFDPSQLFSSNEPGAWYDFFDFNTLFQDAAGSTPVTALEQPVARVLDKSGRGNHASQATAAARGVLSARYNLMTHSEQFSNAIWPTSGILPFGSGSVVDATLAPNNEMTADLIVPTTANAVHTIQQTVTVPAASIGITFYVKAAGYSRVAFRENTTSGNYASFVLSGAGTVLSQSGSTGAIEALPNGWYRVSMTHTPTAGAKIYALYVMNDSYTGTPPHLYSYAGNGTSGIYLWGSDLRPTSDGVGLPVYQRVGAATAGSSTAAGTPDYTSAGFPAYVRLDGSNDGFSSPAVDMSATDKVTVFAGLRKLSDPGSTALVVELSTTAGNVGTFGLQSSRAVAGTPYAFESGGSLAASALAVSSAYTAPNTAVLAATSDISGDLATIRVNGVLQGQSTADQGAGNFGSYALYIGNRAGTSNYFNGRLYSLIIRGAATNATQVAQTETWVNDKTGAY